MSYDNNKKVYNASPTTINPFLVNYILLIPCMSVEGLIQRIAPLPENKDVPVVRYA